MLGAVPPGKTAGMPSSLPLRQPCRIPPGGRVGTGSLRRRVQLLHRRPDLEVCP